MAAIDGILKQGSFKERFCRVYQCAPEQFEERVFRLCLHRRARLFAGHARPDVPGFFGWDWDFGYINCAANASSYEEAVAEVNLYAYYYPPIGPFKDWLHIRLSGRRLIRLIGEVFASDGTAPR